MAKQLKLTTTKRINIHHRYRQITWHKGKIIKNTTWHPPKIKYMWRTTVAINYEWHNKYFSYKVTMYGKHKKDMTDKQKLYDEATAAFEEHRGYTLQELEDAGELIRIGYEKPAKIRYEKHMIGRTEPKDEFLREGRRTKKVSKTFYMKHFFKKKWKKITDYMG